MTKYLIWLFISFTSNYCFSQATIPFVHYTVDDGLPQQQITAIYQDTRGFIWVGTKGGLSRFDGHEFKNFGLNDGLDALQVNSIFPYSDSLLIIQTGMKYLYSFDGISFKSILPTQNAVKVAAVKAPYIFLQKLNEFDQWIGFEVYNYLIKEKKPLENNQVSIKQILMYHDTLFFVDEFNQYGFLNNDFSPISIGKGKNVNLVSIDNRLFLVETNDKNEYFKDFYTQKDVLLTTEHNKEIKILGHPPNYLPSYGKLWKFNELTTSYDFIYDLSSYGAFICDKDDQIWGGTENGLLKYNLNFSFYSSQPFQDIWSVVDDELYHIFRLLHYRDGEYWCDKTLALQSVQDSLNAAFYYFGSTTTDSTLYITTSNGLLVRKKNGEHAFVELEIGSSAMISYVLHNGDVIVGSKKKLIHYKKDGSSTIVIIPDSLVKKNHYIRALLELPDGSVLLGSNTGLTNWNPRTNKFKKTSFSFENAHVVSLEMDMDKNIWVGTDNGLFLSKDKSSSYLPILSETIDNEIITDITLIMDSLILVGTSRRLLAINPKTITTSQPSFKSFNRNNGFMGIEVAQNGIKLFGDQIWIPAITGLSIINKNKLKINKNEFDNLWIEAINGDELSFQQNKECTYSLPHNTRNLSFDYRAIGANRPCKKLYSYRLLGQDDKWSDWTKDETAFFNNLSSGSYTFCLRKKNTTNHDDDDEIQYKVYVDLSLAQEPFFPIIAGAVIISFVILAGLLVFLAEKRKIKLKHEALKANFEKERADNLQLVAKKEALLNTKLQEDNQTIKRLFSTIRHYARRVLLMTRMTINQEAKDQSPEIQTFANNTATRLTSFISVFDMLRNTTSDKLNVNEQVHKLAKHLRNAGSSDEFSVQFLISIPIDLSMSTDRISDLVSIITELVMNSYSHARPKDSQLIIQINITKLTSNQYQLQYKDNGLGIPPPKPNSKSMGYFLIQGFAKNLGGWAVFDGDVVVVFTLK